LIDILMGIKLAMKVSISRRRLGKADAVMRDEAGQEGVCRVDRADAGKSQFLHQTILQRVMRTFYTALGLTGIGTENFNVEFR
jgi:hypothetical protein